MNDCFPGGYPLSHGICCIALLLPRLEKNPGQRRQEGKPEKEEARAVPGKLHLRRRKDCCCSCLQASCLKLLRTVMKGQLWVGLLGLRQGWAHGKAQCATATSSVEERAESPNGSRGGGNVGVSLHPYMCGYLPIQATSPQKTKKKGLTTVEW